ncbi:hypothetical protein [Lysinibacillus pakistanensis]|uniref:Uncharacterized protein n=1 Tax=Lysinibacillus pakistanensis TaxID=759811 RepID=A0ABX6DAG5_9BACI|nr:hypothetical protein GDS87_11705 [Lysinibacillus pakistanensis]
MQKVIEVFNGRLMDLKRSVGFTKEEVKILQSDIKEKENNIRELEKEIVQTEVAIEILKADKALKKELNI